MDLQGLLFYFFAVISTLYVIHLGLYLVGANLYDVWQYRRHIKAREDFPLVTIAIPAHNEEKVIERCLDSIRRSIYPNIETIVVDDASKDHTRQIVQNYMKRYPSMRLRVASKRKNVGKGEALSFVLRRYAKGEFAMMVDADSVIRNDAVTNALTYFDDPRVDGVAANVQIIHDPNVLGILQQLEHMIGYRSKKTYSLLNSEFVVGGVASTYRMNVLRKVNFYDTDTVTEDIGLSFKIVSLGNRAHRMVYGADVVAMTEGVSNFRALVRQRYRWKYGSLQNLVKYRSIIGNTSPIYTHSLTIYRLPMALISEVILLLAPLAWGYALFMTFRQYNLELLLGAYVTISLYMLITIWLDENIRWSTRVRLSLYALTAYFVFYIMDVVQLISIIICLAKINSLIKQKNIGSAWISPQRTGKEMVAINGS